MVENVSQYFISGKCVLDQHYSHTTLPPTATIATANTNNYHHSPLSTPTTTSSIVICMEITFSQERQHVFRLNKQVDTVD